MPGSLSKNFHSGFLNEEYAIFLLRQIAAVAPVGRPEDHGIDAIATLLEAEGSFLYATDTFFIQFKSCSVEAVCYGDGGNRGQLAWLRALQVPLFFGHVSRIENGAPGRLRIYSSQNLMAQLLFLGARTTNIGVCFDAVHKVPTLTDWEIKELELRNESFKHGSGADAETWFEQSFTDYLRSLPLTVWHLGNPIVEFDLNDISDVVFREKVVAVMQSWTRLGFANIASAKSGMSTFAKGETNEEPQITRIQMLPHEPSAQESQELLKKNAVSLLPLLLERLYHGEESDIENVLAVLKFIERDGIDLKLELGYIGENRRQLRNRRTLYRQQLTQKRT